MIQRTAVLCLEIVLAVVLIVLIAAGAIVWRLSDGPIEVAWARGYLENALSDQTTGYATQVGNTTLAWSGWDRAFGLIADDVVLIDPEGAVRARVGSISVALSPVALLAGRLAPERIDVFNPTVTAVRSSEGRWNLLPDFGEGGSDGPPMDLSGILESLVSTEGRVAPLSYLRAVEVQGATLNLIDDARAQTLTLDGVSAGVVLTAQGMNFRLRGEADWPAFAPSPLMAAGSYDASNDRVTVAVDFADLPPPALVEFDPRLERLGALETPLSGRVSLASRPDASDLAVQAELTIAEGRIRIPEVNTDWLAIGGGSVNVDLTEGAEEARIEASLDLEGVALAATLRARRDRAGYGLVLDAGVSELPVDSLKRYWPPALSDGAREWVTENLESGRVDAATMRFEGWIDPAALGSLKKDTLSGRIDFSNVNTHYLRPLPPVIGSSGTATFAERRMDITVIGGQLDGIEAESATIALLDIGLPIDERARIEVAARGPVEDVLRLLDREPLGYPSELGLDVDRTDGQFGARLLFEFPLVRTLEIEDVGIAVSANIQDANIPDALAGEDLADADLALELTASGMTLRGSGILGGTRAEIVHEESFDATATVKARSTVAAIPMASDLEALGLALGDALQGPVAVEANVVTQRDGRVISDLTADLQQAVMRFSVSGWEKPVGAVGILRAVIDEAPDGSVSIPNIEIRAADLIAVAAIRFPANGDVVADLSTFRFGETDAAGRVERLADGSVRITMEGSAIDLKNILERDSDEPNEIVLDARFVADELTLFDGIVLQDGTLSVRLIGPRTEKLSLAGDLQETPLRMSIQPVSGQRLLTVETEDAGAVLSAFGLTDTMQGGRLRVDGELLGDGLTDALSLSTRIDEFMIIDAPVFAQLLSVASLTGLFDTLSGEGIRFARAAGDVTMSPETLEISNAVAFGPGLGLKLDGAIGRDDDSVNIRGLLAPAYSLSRLIDVIPVFGELITGGEGEGLLATSYTIHGTVIEPVITVNPLSALAPGFVRDLLSTASRPGDGPVTAPPLPQPGLEEEHGR